MSAWVCAGTFWARRGAASVGYLDVRSIRLWPGMGCKSGAGLLGNSGAQSSEFDDDWCLRRLRSCHQHGSRVSESVRLVPMRLVRDRQDWLANARRRQKRQVSSNFNLAGPDWSRIFEHPFPDLRSAGSSRVALECVCPGNVARVLGVAGADGCVKPVPAKAEQDQRRRGWVGGT